MAILATPESSKGVLRAIKGALGLFDKTNKTEGGMDDDRPELVDEYEQNLPDEKIIELTSQFKKDYDVYYKEVKSTQDLAFNYWIGKHRDPYDTGLKAQGNATGTPVSDNLIFKSIETFLPAATRANPEPVVFADNTDVGQNFANDIKAALVHFADSQLLRRKLAKGTRSWLLNRLGAWKMSWNPLIQDIDLDVCDIKKMGFDPDGHINEKGEFVGDWIFEKKKLSAEKLSELFPKKKLEILLKCKGRMGTKLEFYEWWYQSTDLFFTLDDTVLGKFKNPDWNYDGEVKVINPETQSEEIIQVQGRNFLQKMSYPYRFLSIFNTENQPHDNTGLIIQNIPQQDKINKLESQIDKNIEGMNNGIVVNGDIFTEEQAAQAANALRKGQAIRVPEGNPKDAVLFPEKPGLPSEVFKNRDDARQQLEGVFGVSGLTSQGIQHTEDVRGKIMVNQADNSRIGGGITEYLEQVADSLYNLYVQMMYVYYDDEHFVANAGAQEGAELVMLKNSNFPNLKTLTITVKEGSLVPKDPLTQRNEAIDLWSANAIDPLTFYKRLDFPDAAEAANQLILWQMLQKGQIQPQQYLPNFQVAGSPTGLPQGGLLTSQPGTGGPAVNNEGQMSAQPPAPQSAPAVQAQSQQLMRSVPEERI
jgi:hypothetical protein